MRKEATKPTQAPSPRPPGRKPSGSSRRWLYLFAALLIVAIGTFVLVQGGGSLLTPKPPSEALLLAAEGLDEIAIEAVFLPEENKVQVTHQMRLTNREDTPLEDIVLRTYANAFLAQETSPAAIEEFFDDCYPEGFSPGGLSLHSVSLGGNEAAYAYEDEAKTILSITPSALWQPGETLELSLAYDILIPKCSYRFGYSDGTYVLGNAFPLPGYLENGQWRRDDYFPLGDPFLSQCANYTLSITMPKGYSCAGSSFGVKDEDGNAVRYHFSAPGVRDFALSISNRYAMASAKAGDAVVTAFAFTEAGAKEALGYAVQAVTCYSENYGAYPYPHLAVAAVDFPFGGMEYPGLILLSKVLYDEGQQLEWACAHEVAHQWWYAVVGSDQYNHPWQDEALAEYSFLDYVGRYYGSQARADMIATRLQTAMEATVAKGVTPGSPIDRFADLAEYTLVVYRRGAALMVALETALGDSFHDFLRAYYSRYAFGMASRQDFEDTLAEVTGRDYSALIIDYLDTHISN